MANECCYDMRVVGRDKESVERMGRILGYEDNEFFLYRVHGFDNVEGGACKDGEFYVATYFGDVAWSPDSWVGGADEDAKNEKGAHLSSLEEICEELRIGVEIWAEEIGIGYQGHIAVDHYGEVCTHDTLSGLETKHGDEDDGKAALKDGIDGYGDFACSSAIYGDY